MGKTLERGSTAPERESFAPHHGPDDARSDTLNQRTQTEAAPAGQASTAVKTFVLDTNVLLHNPHALFVFQDNNVVIPFTVLEELDRFKSDNDNRGRNAREVIRYLDQVRRITTTTIAPTSARCCTPTSSCC